MVLNRLPLKLVVVALLAVFIFISFALRVFIPYDSIFVGDWVKFSSVDAYFHMRMIDQMVANFPHAMSFDPYLLYPGGSALSGVRFYDWLLAGVIWLVGLGSPSQHTIDIIGVYYPVILAALTVIPVYFIGRTLFRNHWAGLFAALFVAIFPGEYLGRSILGFTDYHVAETLFTTTAALFLILAVKTGSQRGLTFGSLAGENRPGTFLPLAYTILAGFFLGIYLITWAGGLLFVFIFTLYFIIQFIVDHLRGRQTQYLGITGGLMFLIALIIFLAVSPGKVQYTAVIIALLLPPALAAIAWLMARRSLKPWYYPLGLVVLGAVFIGVFYTVSPGLFGLMVGAFKIFTPVGASAATTLEMQPFLAPQGYFNTMVAWGNYTTSFFIYMPWWMLLGLVLLAGIGYLLKQFTESRGWGLFAFLLPCAAVIAYAVLAMLLTDEFFEDMAYWTLPGFAFVSLFILIWANTRQPGKAGSMAGRIIALVLLALALGLLNFAFVPALTAIALFLVVYVWLAYRREEDNHSFLFFLVWTLITLILTLVQRRFAYYLVVNMSLLSAYIAWQILWHGGLKDWLALRRQPEPEEAAGKQPAKGKLPPVREKMMPYVFSTFLAGIVIISFIVYPNYDKSREVAGQALFAPSDAWQSSLLWLRDNTPPPFGDEAAYYEYQEKPQSGIFAYPETAYGVTSWWDYGYWITRIGHRLPTSNPSQKPAPIIKTATMLLSDDPTEIRNIAGDLGSGYVVTDYAIATTKFWAMVEWSGSRLDEYIQTYYLIQDNTVMPINGFKPRYYESLVVRLQNFDGKAVPEGTPAVISYDERILDNGQTVYVIPDVDHVNGFESYQQALDYIAAQTEGNHAIVSINPFVSPIPLEAVGEYRLVHSSEQGVSDDVVGMVPEVKIFEYTGD